MSPARQFKWRYMWGVRSVLYGEVNNRSEEAIRDYNTQIRILESGRLLSPYNVTQQTVQALGQ